MAMARQPVAELYVQSQGALVRLGPSTTPVRTDDEPDDLRTWVDRAAIPWSGMVLGGMGTAVLGLVLASINPLGFLGTVAFSSMITLGGGLTFLGILKRKREQDEPPPRALPAAGTAPAVFAERARRVTHVLRDRGEATFETLLGRLRWTESALIETLVYMKNAGALEEDLNLDTGEWVYRVQDIDAVGTPAGLTLAERQARVGPNTGGSV
jgi:hypothetical protein